MIPTNSKKIILTIDDDPNWLFMITELLNKKFEIITAKNGKEGLKKIDLTPIHLVLLDLSLPDFKNLDLLKKIKKIAPQLPVIIVTEENKIKTAVNGIKQGATDFITKKDVTTSLHHIISRNLHTHHLEKKLEGFKLEATNKSSDIFIPTHPVYQFIFKRALNDAKSGLDILIQSPTGTGKEVITTYIRKMVRPNCHIINVNCGAIPESLAESEFFGHEKNTFNDAPERQGKIEQANNGILFLDEIGNMSLNIQQKLLRVLETKSITRLGSSKEIPINFLLISATNIDLTNAVEQGTFREDLLYRIEESKIILPRLSDYPEVIPQFTQYFTNKFNLHYKKTVTINTHLMTLFQKKQWKGNIRELQKCIKRFVARHPDCDDIINELSSPITETHYPHCTDSLSHKVTALEISEITKTISKNNGNISVSAKELGLKRTTLISKIEKLNIQTNTKTPTK
jgi:DNA-binding NtrC family response regulator